MYNNFLTAILKMRIPFGGIHIRKKIKEGLYKYCTQFQYKFSPVQINNDGNKSFCFWL